MVPPVGPDPSVEGPPGKNKEVSAFNLLSYCQSIMSKKCLRFLFCY